MDKKDDKGIIRHIPNALTVGRLVLTVIFLGMILYAPGLKQDKPAAFLTAAFVLFVITAITDIIDGYLARKYEVTSQFGRTVDPLADKFLVLAILVVVGAVVVPALHGPLQDQRLRKGAELIRAQWAKTRVAAFDKWLLRKRAQQAVLPLFVAAS